MIRQDGRLGLVFGENWNEAALKASPEGADALLNQVIKAAQVSAPDLISADPGVEFDILYQANEPAFIVLNNNGGEATVKITDTHTWTGLFSGKTLSAESPCPLTANETDIFARDFKA